jgi:molecular chaperone DnaK (HSP70)
MDVTSPQGGVVGYHLGVDLGTTFVAAAVAYESRVEMFTLGDRTMVTPAVVYLREDGALVSGDAAARRAVSSPDRIGREFKRRLGDPTPVILGGTPYAVTNLLGSLLYDVVTRVTETEGAKPDSVVLTHPANWGPFRRELFDEVPETAGLTATRRVTEPEAAAAHYAASRHLADGDIIAVYDLGGGTFDATVLRKNPTGIEILGIPEGIERLGGVDFDESILSYVNYSAGGALSELDLSDAQTAIALARLRQDCVTAKETLSADTETTIPVFLPHHHFDVRLTRAEFEEMIRAPIESTIGTLTRTLRSAQVDPAELSAVLLVGGSSRIPLVSRMISEELGRPTVVDAHPKYAVALGAATLAIAGAVAAPADVTTGTRPRPGAARVSIPAPRSPEPVRQAAPTATTSARTGTPTGSQPPAPPRTEAPQPAGHWPYPADHDRPPTGPPATAPAWPGGSPPVSPPPPPPARERGSARPLLLVVAAVVGVLALVGGLTYVVLDQFRTAQPGASRPRHAPSSPRACRSRPSARRSRWATRRDSSSSRPTAARPTSQTAPQVWSPSSTPQ